MAQVTSYTNTKIDELIENFKNGVLRARGTLPDGTDLNDYKKPEHSGVWRALTIYEYPNLPWPQEERNQIGIFVTAPSTSTLGFLQLYIEVGRFAWRTSPGSVWGSWKENVTTESFDSLIAASKGITTPSKQLLDLAKLDGWFAVYDPTSPGTVTMDTQGRVTELADGLANAGPLTQSSSGNAPILQKNGFGQLAALDTTVGKRLSGTFGEVLSDPMTVITLSRWSGSKGGSNFQTIVDGVSSGRKNMIIRSARPESPYGFGNGEGNDRPADNHSHIMTLRSHGDHSEMWIDSQQAALQLSPSSTTLGGITIGSTPNGTNGFEGQVGPVLVYAGEIGQEKLNRMLLLLQSLTGIIKGPHLLEPTTVAYSVTESGRTVLTHGDVDMVWPTGIQSITKLMTCLVAREVISDMSEQIAYDSSDGTGNNPMLPGDTMSWEDWMWMSLGPSFNVPNQVISRAAGQRMPGGDPDNAHQIFMEAMNARAESFGYGQNVFTSTFHAAKLSARHTVDLLQRCMADPVLKALLSTRSKQVNVLGPNPRQYTWGHTIPSGAPYNFPEWEGGKTGGGNGDAHVVTAWKPSPGAETHYTAIMCTPLDVPEARYTELKKIMTASVTEGANAALTPSTQPKRGDGLRQTGRVDVTDDFGAIRDGSASAVILERRGDWASLNFQAVSLDADYDQIVIPAGFRPETFEYGVLMSDSVTPREVQISPSGRVQIKGLAAGEILRGGISWRTRREWPV